MADHPRKERLDVWVVDAGHAPSRERAQALIRAGVVFVGGQRVDKPGTRVSTASTLEVRRDPCPYVSRGGIKLAAALDAWGISAQHRTALDIGASTGGFTDCLLQRGATRVIAVDVGHNQLDYRLRSDPRVTTFERVNVRTWATEHPAVVNYVRTSAPTLVVGDVSFISLTLIFPALVSVAAPASDAVFLVKPQFEAGRDAVGKGGIVRDELHRAAAVARVVDFAREQLGWLHVGTMESPIHGAKGNVEFLVAFRFGG